jgi:hypothetical protein
MKSKQVTQEVEVKTKVKYCDDCAFYSYKDDICNRVTGESITPKRKNVTWAIPSIDNKSNRCKYFISL